MVQQLSSTNTEIIYPDSDGQPMADNTKQFEWIVVIKENLELLYADNPDVFVAGDLLWYPVEGNNKIRQAPDAMVAFGRAKGHRGSYQQWKEGDVPPQVVFEILSPGNRRTEMNRKLLFYERYGVEEYYEYDPDCVEFSGCQRKEGRLEIIDFTDSWVSPRLGVRFVLKPETLEVYKPNGERFLTFVELGKLLENTKAALEDTKVALETSDAKNKRLMARLEALGVDPDTV
ncbi:MAG: Uma2 family endonuclease [Phormidesmis sp.]